MSGKSVDIHDLNAVSNFLMERKSIPENWSTQPKKITYSYILKIKDLDTYNYNWFTVDFWDEENKSHYRMLEDFKFFEKEEKETLTVAFKFFEEALGYSFQEIKDKPNRFKNNHIRFFAARQRMGDNGGTTVGRTNLHPHKHGYTPVIMIDTSYIVFSLDTYGYRDSSICSTMVHEIGHAYGLGHPHRGGYKKQEFDSGKYTVMSYNDYNDQNPSTLMKFDYLTLHAYYGPNKSQNAGNTYYQWDDVQLGKLQCLWDASGIDQFDISKAKHPTLFDMRDGEFSTIGSDWSSRDEGWNFSGDEERRSESPSHENFSLAYTTKLENLTGSDQGDIIFTNGLDNIINLGNKDDIVYFSNLQIDTTIRQKGKKRVFQRYTKSIRANRKTYFGWGNDVLYSSAGFKKIVLDVDDVRRFKFEKKDKNLVIKHVYGNLFSKIKYKSSLTITNYDPSRYVIFLRVYNRDDITSVYVNYSEHSFINPNKAKKYPNHQLKSKKYLDRIDSYDRYMAKIGLKKPQIAYIKYMPLVIESL